jgi:hypothetical protein
MVNSRRKGAAFERVLAKKFALLGYRALDGGPARRGQQYCGANGDPDIAVSLPLGIMVEAKSYKALSQNQIYRFLQQAMSESITGNAVVISKIPNTSDEIVVMDWSLFITLIELLREKEDNQKTST